MKSLASKHGFWGFMAGGARMAAILGLLCLVCAMAGCASTDESSIPWNRPQSWEGAPAIPIPQQ